MVMAARKARVVNGSRRPDPGRDGGLAVFGVGILRGVVLEGHHVLAHPDAVHGTRLGLARHRGEELRRGEGVGGRQPDVEVHALLPGRCRDPEDGVLGGDAAQIVVGGVCRHAVEEPAHLELPAAEIGAQDVDLVVITELLGMELLHVPADDELAFTGRPEVAHPFCLAPRRHQVAPVVEGEDVHGVAAPLARLPPRTRSTREPHTLRPSRVRPGHGGVEDLVGRMSACR